jgi:hypothetical protein
MTKPASHYEMGDWQALSALAESGLPDKIGTDYRLIIGQYIYCAVARGRPPGWMVW